MLKILCQRKYCPFCKVVWRNSHLNSHLFRKFSSVFKRTVKAVVLSAALLSILLLARPVMADTFVVQHINVLGLQRVSESTVLSYVPVQVGQSFSDKDSANVLEALFKTGFFSQVHLKRSGNTLIINVKENPTLGRVEIQGNKAVKDKQLNEVLKKLNIAEGEVYDPAKVNAIQQGLEEQYQQLGYYAVKVSTKTYKLPRNRVGLVIHVDEGPIAKIQSIKIEGNKAFSQHKLLKNFSLTKSGLLTWITHTDRYSEIKLDQDLQTLTHFYYDHGYLRFAVVSKKVDISPDHKHVSITIKVSEGSVYKVNSINVKGVADKDRVAINKLLLIKVGQPFSRQKIMNTNTQMTNYYADRGHALAKVNVVPQLNDKAHQVAVTFVVTPGPLVYVRQIHFAGNAKTSSLELRKRLIQLEGSTYSRRDVNVSKQKLAQLPYLSNVKVTTQPVSGKADQVDLQYHVDEVSAGRATVQVGYSDTDGFLVGANITEPNFLGTGKFVSLAFQRSASQTSVSYDYNNPYYTVNGISRGFSIFYNNTKPNSSVNLDESYSMNRVGGLMHFGIPVSDFDMLNFGAGYSYIDINASGSKISPNVSTFLADYPSPYNQFDATGSWIHSTLDRGVFPTQGLAEQLSGRLGVPVIRSSLAYYTITSTTRYYYSLGKGFIINPKLVVGYGNGYGRVDSLPFFDNFFAGGISTMPGYAANSLGPENPATGDAIGGNFEGIATLNLIFPNFISPKLRTAITVNAGNIFETEKVPGISYESIRLGNLRTSAGLMVVWYSPLGLLQFDVAEALNSKHGDHTQIFDFSFGSSL